MKIAVVAPTYIPAKRANTFQIMKMTQALVQTGQEVRLLIPGTPPEALTWAQLSEQYGLRTSFPVEWLPASASLRSYDFCWRAVRQARRWAADMIYTRHPQTAALASCTGIPTILEVHDYPQGRLGPILFRLYLAGRGARRVVAITHALADDLNTHSKSNRLPSLLLVAPDGVDLERYSSLPDPLGSRRHLHEQGLLSTMPVNRLTAGYTGHLYPGRGEDLLLGLASRLPNLNFLVVGGEADTIQRLQAKTVSMGLDNLYQAGFVSNASLPIYQAACDFLLVPYSIKVAASSGGDIARYTSPMKVFEYLAAGRAILSSDLPVLREVLNQENSVLLPPDDLEIWSETLESLANDAQRRAKLALNARTDAENYTWEARSTRIIESL